MAGVDVAVCRTVLQCVAPCCTMLQCVAVCEPSRCEYLTCMGGGSVGSSLREEPFVSRVLFHKKKQPYACRVVCGNKLCTGWCRLIRCSYIVALISFMCVTHLTHMRDMPVTQRMPLYSGLEIILKCDMTDSCVQ